MASRRYLRAPSTTYDTYIIGNITNITNINLQTEMFD